MYPGWRGEIIAMQWSPSLTVFLLLLILPPVLLLATLLVAGGYRRAFLAGLSCVAACLIATVWFTTAQRGAHLIARQSASDPSTWYQHRVLFSAARGGIQLDCGLTADATGHMDYPLVVVFLSTDKDATYPRCENRYANPHWPRALAPLGLEFATYWAAHGPFASHGVSVTLPCWLALLLCVPFPALWLYRRLRPRETELPGHCPACGYDLRMHKSGDACPECGKRIAGPVRADETAA